MAEVLLFHHALGQTQGFLAFADQLRARGNTVHTPDFYDGRTFPTIEEGVAFVEATGLPDRIATLAEEAASGLPHALVYAGLSLGVLPAQQLAQVRPGARGAVLVDACLPPAFFGGPWPTDVDLQVHGMDADPFFVEEGDLDAARELVASAPSAELFLYPGTQHLFVDASLPSYRADAADLLIERILAFLEAH